jgi:hypothetical protein
VRKPEREDYAPCGVVDVREELVRTPVCLSQHGQRHEREQADALFAAQVRVITGELEAGQAAIAAYGVSAAAHEHKGSGCTEWAAV